MQAGVIVWGGLCVFVCVRKQMERGTAPPASRHSPVAVATLPAPHPKTPQRYPSDQSDRPSCIRASQSKDTPKKGSSISA